MDKIAVWGFRWAPEFAQGLVRDLRVRWALREIGQDYEVRLIDFMERDSAAYRQHQPFGMVPVLEVDGASLFESGAIVYRIAGESSVLMPADAQARTRVLTWMFAALNTIEPPIQNLLEMDLIHRDQPWVPLRRPAEIERIRARLSALAAELEGRDYLLGASFTAADLLMSTSLRLLRHTDLLTEFPLLSVYVRRCEARPAFRAALDEQMAEYARHVPLAA